MPERIPGRQRIVYLHIDLNHAPAEIAALDQLFDGVAPGGVIIFDDYEWGGVYRPQKIAEDAWRDARQYRVSPLPAGQGFVIKR
jgi:predicted O-methyltransferase YrrM